MTNIIHNFCMFLCTHHDFMGPEHCTSTDQVFEIQDVTFFSAICQSCLPCDTLFSTKMPELQQHNC